MPPSRSAPDHLEQPLRLVAGQRRGRLVHRRAAARRARSRAGSRPSAGRRCAACARPPTGSRPKPVRSISSSKRLAQLAARGRRRRRSARSRGTRSRARCGRDERDLLGDHRDPVVERVARRAEAHGLAVDEQLALVGAMHAGDHLAERRLAGAVLADQAVDVPALDRDATPSSAWTPPNRFEIPRASTRGRASRAPPRPGGLVSACRPPVIRASVSAQSQYCALKCVFARTVLRQQRVRERVDVEASSAPSGRCRP